MLCEEVRRRLELRDEAGELLSKAERHEVEQHLAECVNCRSFESWLRQQDMAIGSKIRNVSVPAQLKHEIIARLGLVAQSRERSRRTLSLYSRRVWLAAASVAFVCGGALLWFLRRWQDSTVVLDDASLLELAAHLEFMELSPPERARKDWQELKRWYREETGLDLVWPEGLTNAAIRRVGVVKVEQRRAAALELVAAFPGGQSFLVVALARSGFELDKPARTGLRVIRDSESLSVAVWSGTSHHFVVVYRGRIGEIRECLTRVGGVTV